MIEPESKKQIETLANIMADPWGNTVLQEILNSDTGVQEQKALEFINSESPEVIRSRIQVLEETNCQDFALRLCTWCLRCDSLENDSWLKKKYIKLLYQQGHIAKLSEEICKLSCDSGLELVDEFLQTKDSDASAINVAECLVQILLVRDLIQPSEYCCSKRLMESWLNIHELQKVDVKKISEEALKLCSLSTTSAHIYVMIDLLFNKFGYSMLTLHLRLFIHALTVDLNFLENARLNDSFEEVSDLESHVADMLYKLGRLLDNYPDIKKECLLTAFSVDPSIERLATLEELAELLDIYENDNSVPLNVPLVPCSGECHCREKGECRRILSDINSVTEYPDSNSPGLSRTSSINRESVGTVSSNSVSHQKRDNIGIHNKNTDFLPNVRLCSDEKDESSNSVLSNSCSATESELSSNCNELNLKSQVSKELSCDTTSHQFDNQTDNEPLPNFMLFSENVEQFMSPVHKHWEESDTPISGIRPSSQHSKDYDNNKSINDLTDRTTTSLNPSSTLGVYPQYSGTSDIYSVSSSILDCYIDGVTKEMLKDLTIVLDEPRRKTLTWNSAWPELKQRCEEHLSIKLALKASSSVYSWKKKDNSEIISDDENSGSDDLILQQANELIQGDIPKMFSSDSEDETSELSANEDSMNSDYNYKSYYASCNMNPMVVLSRNEVERNFKYKQNEAKNYMPMEMSPSGTMSDNYDNTHISNSNSVDEEHLIESSPPAEETSVSSDYIENDSVTAENTGQLLSSSISIPTVPPNSVATALEVINPVQQLYDSQETFSVSSQNTNESANNYSTEEAKTENLLSQQSISSNIENQYHVQAVTLPTHIHSLSINSATPHSLQMVRDENLNTQVCPAENSTELSDKSDVLNLLLSDSLPVVNCKQFIPNVPLQNLLNSSNQVFSTDKTIQNSTVDSLIQVTSVKTPICSTSANDLLKSSEMQTSFTGTNSIDISANEQMFVKDITVQQDDLTVAVNSSCGDATLTSAPVIHLEPKVSENLISEPTEALLNNSYDSSKLDGNILLNDLENLPVKDSVNNLITEKGVTAGVTSVVDPVSNPPPVFPSAANTMTCAYLVQTVQSNLSSQSDPDQNCLKQSSEATVPQFLTPATVRLSGITNTLPLDQKTLMNSMRVNIPVSSHSGQRESSVPSKDTSSASGEGEILQNGSGSAANNFASPCNGQAFLITVTVPVSNCTTAQDSCKGTADLNTARVFTNSECGPNSANLLSKSNEDSKSESGYSNSSTESLCNQGVSSDETLKNVQTKSSDFQDNYKQFLLGRAIDKQKLIAEEKKNVKETTATTCFSDQSNPLQQKLLQLNMQAVSKEPNENQNLQLQKGLEMCNKIQIQEGTGLPTLQRQLIPLPHSQLSVQVATSGTQKTSSVTSCIAKPLSQVNLVAKGKTYFQPKNISGSTITHNMLTVSNVMVPPRVSSASPLPRATSPLLQTILESANRTTEDGISGNDKKKLFSGKGDRRKWVSVRNQHGIMEYKKVENQVNSRIIQGYFQTHQIPSYPIHNHSNSNVNLSVCNQSLSLTSPITSLTPAMVTLVQAPIISSCSQQTPENCSKVQISKFDSHLNFINPIIQSPEKGQEMCKTTSATALPVVSAMENISYVQAVVNNVIGKASPKKKATKADVSGGSETGEDNLPKKKKPSVKKKQEQTIDGKPLKTPENPKHYCDKCEKYLCSTFSLRRHLQSVHKIITQDFPKPPEGQKSPKSKKKPSVNKTEAVAPSKSKFDATDCNNEEIMKQVQAIMDQVKNSTNVKSPLQKSSDNLKPDKNDKQYQEHKLLENLPEDTVVSEKSDIKEADNQLVDNSSISLVETELENIRNCSDEISDLLRIDSNIESENFGETAIDDCTTELTETKEIVLSEQNNENVLLDSTITMLPCITELSDKEQNNEDFKEQKDDTQKQITDMQEQINDSKESIGDSKEPIDNLKEPIDDSKELIGNLKEPIGDSKEPISDSKESVSLLKEPSDELPSNNSESSLPSKENSCESSSLESEVTPIIEDETIPCKRSKTKEKVKDVDDTSTEGSTDGASPIKVRTRARNSKPPSKRCCPCCEEKTDPSGKRCRTDKKSSKSLRGPSKRLKETKRNVDCPRTRSAVRR